MTQAELVEQKDKRIAYLETLSVALIEENEVLKKKNIYSLTADELFEQAHRALEAEHGQEKA